MSYRQFPISYTDWKVLQAALSSNVYYETFEDRFKPLIIDVERENVYFALVNRLQPNSDLTDFETNIQPGATAVVNVSTAVSIEVPIAPALPVGPTPISQTGTDNDVDVTSLPVAAGGQETLVRIAFGLVPAAYGVGAQLVTTAVRNHIKVRNDTDETILFSLDGATNHFKILAHEVGTFDGVTIANATTIRIKHDGAAPTLGEVTISAWSDR